MRSLGDRGRQLIQSFEKLETVAYLDEGGVPTIGWGHTGPEVHLGLVWTVPQCEVAFDSDTQHTIQVLDGVVPLSCSQNQFDALVAFAFNVGVGAFLHSTLLAKLKAGSIDEIGDELMKWDHVGGVVSAGLERRREAEKALFYRPDSL